MEDSTLLLRSVESDECLFIFRLTYPQPQNRLPILSLAQMLRDRTETNGHATHITADPYPDTPPRRLLLHLAFGDFQVADVTADVAAGCAGRDRARLGGALRCRPPNRSPSTPSSPTAWGRSQRA